MLLWFDNHDWSKSVSWFGSADKRHTIALDERVAEFISYLPSIALAERMDKLSRLDHPSL